MTEEKKKRQPEAEESVHAPWGLPQTVGVGIVTGILGFTLATVVNLGRDSSKISSLEQQLEQAQTNYRTSETSRELWKSKHAQSAANYAAKQKELEEAVAEIQQYLAQVDELQGALGTLRTYLLQEKCEFYRFQLDIYQAANKGLPIAKNCRDVLDKTSSVALEWTLKKLGVTHTPAQIKKNLDDGIRLVETAKTDLEGKFHVLSGLKDQPDYAEADAHTQRLYDNTLSHAVSMLGIRTANGQSNR